MNRNLVLDLTSREINMKHTTRNLVTLKFVNDNLKKMYQEEWFFESDNILVVYMILLQIAKENTTACCELYYILNEAYKSELTSEGYEVIRSVVFVASQLIEAMMFKEREQLNNIIENIKVE